jgi:hypothetical protein
MAYQTFEEGGACDVENVTYHLRGNLIRPESMDKSNLQQPGALLVTVAESTSVVQCSEDLVRVASPGAELSTTAYESDATSFTLDLAAVIIGGQRPSIWVQALVDANDNGSCDDGELVGAVELEADALEHLAIELRDEGCPTRS